METPNTSAPSADSAPAPATQTTEPKTAQAQTEEPKKEGDSKEKVAQRLAKTKAREAQIAAKKKELEAQIAEAKTFQELKAGGAKNAKKLLDALGITYDQLTNALLDEADPASSSVREVHDKVAQLEARIKEKEEAERRAREEQEAREFNEAATAYEASVKNFLDTNADKYEIAHKSSAASLVRKVVIEYYHEHKKLLSMEEACDLVEKHLEGQLRNFTSSKKLRSWLQPNEDKGTNTTTLTNDNSRSMATPEQPNMSREERMKRALLKLEGKI